MRMLAEAPVLDADANSAAAVIPNGMERYLLNQLQYCTCESRPVLPCRYFYIF